MISETELFHALKLLSDNLYKIVEIDLNNDAFYEIKVSALEKTERKHLQSWIRDFAKKKVHPDDMMYFLEFFDIEDTKECLRNNWMRRCYYRRKVGSVYRYVCIEAIKTETYDEDNNAIILLSVRDVEDYINDFKRQGILGANEDDSQI